MAEKARRPVANRKPPAKGRSAGSAPAPSVEDSLFWQRAQDAFRALTEAGLDASLQCIHVDGGTAGNTNSAELDIVIERNLRWPSGLLYEDIQLAGRIAEEYGGRLWLGQPDLKLSIVWPTSLALGPEGQTGDDADREKLAIRGRRP